MFVYQVGQRSSGKTSLVQMIAELTGNKLEVLAMNSSMDTTELLGGFEQVQHIQSQRQKIIVSRSHIKQA